METPWPQRVGELLLGQDKRQRVRAARVLSTTLLDVVLAGIAGFGVWAGLLDGRAVAAWSALTIAGTLVFYALVRSGFNLRFESDPALTLPQGMFSVMSAVGGYLMCGPVRGASLLALTITLVFGMFALKPREVRSLSLFAVTALGITMALANHLWPQRFPASEEAMHFLLAAVLLPSLAVLAGELSSLRHKLREHRATWSWRLRATARSPSATNSPACSTPPRDGGAAAGDSARRPRRGPALHRAVDIDHFKRINDNHGHAQGDDVLRAFAACAAGALRDTDTLGRWGGEEFIVMLPDTPIEAAAGVMARVHAQLASVCLDAIHPGLRVTFSAGIAVRGAGEPLAATIERADQAMYAAKQGGRNRSVVAKACEPVSLPAAALHATPVA